ncbi:MAG: HNH endonuclease [Cephaloticoccus sp.]
MIPTAVKREVWKRDNARCAQCGSIANLHFDHIIPWSKGGSSTDVQNIQLLCAAHNLSKSDEIL